MSRHCLNGISFLPTDSSPVSEPEPSHQGEERGASPEAHQRADRQGRVRGHRHLEGQQRGNRFDHVHDKLGLHIEPVYVHLKRPTNATILRL